ncbi:hypothetical protein [Almyronema epifaneia]|uniref:DUF5082 domain-containing protein n=1 Tax=Almyronema epifaneia S1 TaxID=2991925 RepID=A0ABW6IMC0_9CYAN
MANLQEIQEILNQTARQQAINTTAIAALRESIAETKAIADSNARAIQAWSIRIDEERTETIDAEVELLSQLQETKRDMNQNFSQVNQNFNRIEQVIQTLTNAIFNLIQQIADMQRRAS